MFQDSRKALKRVSSSSSPSSSASSSSSSTYSSSPFSASQNPRAKTMEEVWKDINLSSLQDQPSSIDDHNTTSFRGMMFQDFLARPFDKDPHPTAPGTGSFGGGSTASAPPPPPSHPATMLTLNSGPEFNLFGNLSPPRQSPLLQPRNISHACPLNMQFDGICSCGGMNAHVNTNKRCAEPEDNNNTGDRRHKRMIKNRESAARSRARKQAYTTELELEVDHLRKENARLRDQQRQICLAVATDRQLTKKHPLHRTSTAPF